MSNGLDPDQDGPSVGPDLGSNCLQRLSAENSWMKFRTYCNGKQQRLKRVCAIHSLIKA